MPDALLLCPYVCACLFPSLTFIQGIVQAMTDRVREAEEATANSDQNDDKTREDLAAIRKKQADIKNEVRGIKVSGMSTAYVCRHPFASRLT